jgi:hypothetical protein
MSVHQAFRRMPVQQQMALRHQTITLPAPIRGLSLIENWAYTKPGSALVLDNWFPTQRGLRLRGGCQEWTRLPDPVEPIISAFNYASSGIERMYAATDTRLFDVTFAGTPTLIATVTDGNYSAAQMANAGGDWLLIVNDAGDYVRRYDGTAWEYLDPASADTNKITWDIGGGTQEEKAGLTAVWKYRNRLFFVEGGTMDAWYLDLNAVGGELSLIPLSGAATKGGSLLFGATWSVDAGDGLDDKCVFCTTKGEVLIFTGSDPSTASNWRQEGRYELARPMGKNATEKVGGDLLVETSEGIVPLSAALSKDAATLSLAAITRAVEPMWSDEVIKRNVYSWSMIRWDEQNMLVCNFPGGVEGDRHTLVINLHTGAAARYTGWDTMCFVTMGKLLFFGTQDGAIMQAEVTGYDNSHLDDTFQLVGQTYVASMIGGWEMFQAPPNQVTWLQARASYFSRAAGDFQPQLGAAIDHQLLLPAPPGASPSFEIADVWDQGLWDDALWDQPAPGGPLVRNTMWVSIGETGFSHAPIVQVSVGQKVRPDIELISIAATSVRMAANV